jgi:hypothetical protein
VIEPTDEMIDAYDDAAREHPVGLGELRVPNVREGLAAVLAIVERDYRLAPRRYGQGQALHRRTTDDLLREVATVYRKTKGRPVDAVAAHLNCATRTAWLWIRRAREAGLLPEVVRS